MGNQGNFLITLKILQLKQASSYLCSNHLDPLVRRRLIPGFLPLALEGHSPNERQGPDAECWV